MLALRQTWALAVLVLRYWARAGLPNRLRKDQGRRVSGALLRVGFLFLMVGWGNRIGGACARLDAPLQPRALSWILVGLFSLGVAWGAMGRGPGVRGMASPLTSPLLDALPISVASRVVIHLLERVMLYALGTAAIVAAAPGVRVDLLLVAVALPTAGLLSGDAATRLLRIVLSPLQAARVSTFALVLQFPSFMLIGGAPVLGKLPRASRLVSVLLPSSTAILEGSSLLLLGGALAGVAALASLTIRGVERIGYDRIDIVPTRRLEAARPEDLDLVRIERVLALREPAGRWLVRGAFLYALAVSALLLATSRLSRWFPHDDSLGFARSLGYVAIVSGFGVVQGRATRMVLRDTGARAMLAPLPITPSDLLRGKTRALVMQTLFVASPYFLVMGMPGSASLRLELLWRCAAAAIALMLAAAATVAIAFLTQGVGGMRAIGGSMGIETTLVAIPLLGVAAAPGVWSAAVSLVTLGLLAYEARRSALHVVRWMDDSDDFERETPAWRALLVFAVFQAALNLGQRALALVAIDPQVQSSLAYTAAAAVLLALTAHGRRGLPRMRALPPLYPLWILAGLSLGVLSGGFSVAFKRLISAAGVALPPPFELGDARQVVTFVIALAITPIAEETFFRGWLQNAIEEDLPVHRRWLAPVLGAVSFACLRTPAAFVPGVVLGLLSGLLFVRTRALGPSIALHAAHLTVVVALAFR